MSAIRCAKTAAAVGKLNQSEKKAMERLWLREFDGLRAGGMDENGATAKASEEVMGAIRGLAAHARQVAQLQIQAQRKISHEAGQFRNRKGQADIGEFGQHLVNRVFFEADALFQLAQTELGAMIHEFRRKPITGLRHNTARMELVRKELFGEETGDAEAKIFAEAWKASAERLRQLYNSVGGMIGKLEDWRLPQMHNALSVGSAGLDKWKRFIRPLLDSEKMKSPLTGKVMSGAELEEALDSAYESIVSHGATEETGLLGQRGVAMWRRRFDPRFFLFKDSEAWSTYQKQFGGGGDEFETMMGWVRSMTHDIAAMQHLGPSADATVHWLTGPDGAEGGMIMAEALRSARGEKALFPPENDVGAAFKNDNQRFEYARIKAHATQQMWKNYAGYGRRPVNAGWAMAQGAANNMIFATALKFTTLLTGSDLVNQGMTRWFNGVPMRAMLADALWAFKHGFNRADLTDYGIASDVAHSTMMSEAREVALIQAQAWSRGIADRAMTYTLLKPVTMGMRAMWTVGNLRALARHSGKAYDKLPRALRGTLAKYDIDAGAWDVIQATPVRDGLMSVKDIAATDILAGVQPRPGLNRGQEVALRVLTLIRSEGEAATVSGTPRSSRYLQTARPGTALGMLSDSVSKLKSYSISHVQNHGYRAMELYYRNGRGFSGAAAGAAYMGSLLAASMGIVALGQMANDIAHGQDVDLTSPDYLDRLFWKTVSLGFWSDTIQALADPDPTNRDMFAAAGPLSSRASHFGDLAAGVFQEGKQAAYGEEDKINTGRKLMRVTREWTPTTWYTDLPVQRLVFDNMQRLVDPEADEAFARAAKRAEDQGRPYWWAPGETTPGRAPQIGR